jgi:hypothetical protein
MNKSDLSTKNARLYHYDHPFQGLLVKEEGIQKTGLRHGVWPGQTAVFAAAVKAGCAPPCDRGPWREQQRLSTHKSVDSCRVNMDLSTAGGAFRKLLWAWATDNKASANTVEDTSSACQYKEKWTCPQNRPRSTNTTTKKY